ncbi:nucleoporin protein Ndc1-Nup [Nemania sp. NC0429]|nr:nucleoporin protein Ndc1-Nup [Nemania sp. NC0429]
MAPPVARRAPYKDFLQPALQRRFAGTAAIVLGLAYLESLTLSHWHSLIWAWLPLGLPGLRALAIFICVLPVIILRIAHGHLGTRTANSAFETLLNAILPFSTFETVLTYVISALFFSQIYLKSTPEEAGIRWISYATGRSRLNEHAVFYTTSLVLLGLVQGVVHVALDQNRLLLGVVKMTREGDVAAGKTTPENLSSKVRRWTPVLVVRSGVLAVTVALANYAVLYYFLRRSAWRSSMWFFRIFYSDLPKYNLPLGSAPWSFWMLGRTIWASFLLGLLWYLGDIAFRVQLTREPLKKGQPLTAESKDPNGSLLNGLKSKKPRISAFAMWELALIARDYAARRQSIFDDIDRKEGPMWSQIYALCLDNIRSIERRIDEYGKPAAPAPGTELVPVPPQPRERISQPLKSDDVSIPSPRAKGSALRESVSRALTSPGKTPIESLLPKVKMGAVRVADRVMTEKQKKAIQPEVLRGYIGSLSLRVLALPLIGPIFQQRFDQQLAKAVLGAPYAETSVCMNAAYALSQLAGCSLAEDKYGNVQRDVANIIRTFTAVIRKLEAFRDAFPTHWTDMSQDRQCRQVSEVVTALKEGLGALVEAFGPYSSDLRLSRADMRMAREAATRGQEGGHPEMQQLG